eukprot:4154061-Prymnesium_polylepis.1
MALLLEGCGGDDGDDDDDDGLAGGGGGDGWGAAWGVAGRPRCQVRSVRLEALSTDDWVEVRPMARWPDGPVA